MTIDFVLLKVSKNDQFGNLYISSYREARNITFGLHLKLIQRVLLSTLSQEVLILLPHNHVTLTNHFFSSYRGVNIIKLGQ